MQAGFSQPRGHGLCGSSIVAQDYAGSLALGQGVSKAAQQQAGAEEQSYYCVFLLSSMRHMHACCSPSLLAQAH